MTRRKPPKRASEAGVRRKATKKRGRKPKAPQTALAVREVPRAMATRERHSQTAKTLWEAAMASLNPKTRYAYAGEWRRFAQWWGIEPEKGEELHQTALKALCAYPKPFAPRELVLAYRSWLDHEKPGKRKGEETFGVAPATRARAIRALNSMVDKLNFVGYTDWVLKVPPGKVSPRRDVTGPDQKTWKKLLRHVKKTGTRGDVAMLHALRSLALRAHEVVKIKLSDLNKRTGRLEVIGKGDKFVAVEVHPKLFELFEAVAAEQKAEAKRRRQKAIYLFGDPVEGNSYDWLYYKVRGWGEDIDIQLWPHALRHSGITEAARLAIKQGLGVKEVQQFSRHAKAETALGYIKAQESGAKDLARGMLDD